MPNNRDRRKVGRRAVAFVATLITATCAFVVASPVPASAIGTWVHRVCEKVENPYNRGVEWADFCVGFDYSGTNNGNRIRAYAKVVVRSIYSTPPLVPVNVELLRLGDGNGIISEVEDVYGYPNTVELNTPRNYQCHTALHSYYNARARIGVNWSTGGGAEWEGSVYNWRSVNSIDAACTPHYLTYYFDKSPVPPFFVDSNSTVRFW